MWKSPLYPSTPSPSQSPRGMAALELLHPGQHGQVLLAAQLPVITSRVPRVEGVEPDHVEGLGTGGSHAGHAQATAGPGGPACWCGPPTPPTSGGRENLLNFITWYMYSAGERVSPPGAQRDGPHHRPALGGRPPAGLTVMAPRHEDVLQAAVGLVHAEFRAAGREWGEGFWRVGVGGQQWWSSTCIEGPGGQGCPGRWCHGKPPMPGDDSPPGRCLQRPPTGDRQAAVGGP